MSRGNDILQHMMPRWPRSASPDPGIFALQDADVKNRGGSFDTTFLGRAVAFDRVAGVMTAIAEDLPRVCARRGCEVVALAAFCVIAASPAADAHVKWFSHFDVAEQPVLLDQVISAAFCRLTALALFIFVLAALIDRSPVGTFFQRALDLLTAPIYHHTDTLMRATYGAFFVALWAKGHIILTPELKTTEGWVSWLQLAIAAGMLSQPTMVLSGLGIVALFAKALSDYGLFHLMDYPIFLGAAAYLVLAGTGRSLFGLRPLDVVRYAAAVTLMWASIEKWAYPQWTYPVLAAHPEMTFGYDAAFYMTAAGVVEFSLAFALAWTPLARRAAALVLATMFVMAVFEFGKIDAIGHSPIVIILLAIVADEARDPRRHAVWAAPGWYTVAISGFIAMYYVAHAEIFGTAIL